MYKDTSKCFLLWVASLINWFLLKALFTPQKKITALQEQWKGIQYIDCDWVDPEVMKYLSL